jgi:hypothetical protein
MNRLILLSILLCVPLTAAETGGTRRALLVAVEPWPEREQDPANGAGSQDLRRMSRLLTEQWQFDPSQIRQLYDREATLRAVVKAFEDHLITPGSPDDSVIIYWSSHGLQVADLDGDEPDGLDEAYQTYDWHWSDPATWFTDDLFHELLERIPARQVLVITDTCHAGGSTRGEADADESLPRSLISGFLPLPEPRQLIAKPVQPSRVVHLAACAADEVSYGGVGRGGYFSMALDDVWRRPGAEDLSFHQILQQVSPLIAQRFAPIKGKLTDDQAQTWTPQAEGPTTKTMRRLLKPAAAAPDNPPPGTPAPAPGPLPIWQKQSGDIQIQLSTDKTTYTEGDLMSVTLTPDHDCHIRLYYLSAEHQALQIFPNQYQTEDRVLRGQSITLPGPQGQFQFRMSPPYGIEVLMAVASSTPFTEQDSNYFRVQLFREFENTHLESLAHRGVHIIRNETLTGRALHLYRVEARK